MPVPPAADRLPAAPRRPITAAELQDLLDGAGAACALPAGVAELPADTRLVVPRGMRIDGAGTTLRVAGGAPPTRPLLDADGLGDGERLEVHGLRIEGPDTTGWDPMTHVSASALSWARQRTWRSVMVVRGVVVTGGYGNAVMRSGGGRLEVTGCDLSGWVDGIACFESHGGHGSAEVVDTTLRAPANSKHSSVGMYHHPHLPLRMERVRATGWNRYAVYVNGTPQGAGEHRLVEVVAQDCALVQGASGALTVLERCAELGTPVNGGSFLKGGTHSTGTRWAGRGVIGVLDDADVERRFTGDAVRTDRHWLALGPRSAGRVVLDGVRATLEDRGVLVGVHAGSRAEVTVQGCVVEASGTGVPLNVEGGTLRLVGTPLPPRSRIVAPGRLA